MCIRVYIRTNQRTYVRYELFFGIERNDVNAMPQYGGRETHETNE